jgi:hypothetical protein
MTQKSLNLVNRWEKYWKMFDDKVMFGDRWFYPYTFEFYWMTKWTFANRYVITFVLTKCSPNSNKTYPSGTSVYLCHALVSSKTFHMQGSTLRTILHPYDFFFFCVSLYYIKYNYPHWMPHPLWQWLSQMTQLHNYVKYVS